MALAAREVYAREKRFPPFVRIAHLARNVSYAHSLKANVGSFRFLQLKAKSFDNSLMISSLVLPRSLAIFPRGLF